MLHSLHYQDSDRARKKLFNARLEQKESWQNNTLSFYLSTGKYSDCKTPLSVRKDQTGQEYIRHLEMGRRARGYIIIREPPYL